MGLVQNKAEYEHGLVQKWTPANEYEHGLVQNKAEYEIMGLVQNKAE